MKKIASGLLLTFCLLLTFSNQAWAEESFTIDSANAGLAIKVAPGELLPISVKLLNFGGGKRVDVLITYSITSEKGVEVYHATETVAVETTNAFVKTVQIPFETAPGVYTAKTALLYQGQETPATTGFSFRVEKKFLGLFQGDFLLYGVGTFIVSLLMLVIGFSLVKRSSPSRSSPIEYSNIPGNERVFYELISDTILGMRQKVGERALDIASQVEGLVIDRETGRIVKLTGSPSRIISELVSGYEKSLGKKVSFSFRDPAMPERR